MSGLSLTSSQRREFGFTRTHCGCVKCQLNCRHMPGFLAPSDLGRMIPECEHAPTWAETQLLASPGALVSKGGRRFRIHTLVPAVKADGACIHLTAEGRCDIHQVAPFGCAYFDCGPDPRLRASTAALLAVMEEWFRADSLYVEIWIHLHELGLIQEAPEVLIQRIKQEARL